MVPEKGTMAYGAHNVLVNALKLEEGERLLIITDESRKAIGEAFYEQGKSVSGKEPTLVVLEDIAQRPLTRLPAAFEKLFEDIDVCVFCASGQEGELAFRRPLLKLAGKVRYGHGIGITQEIMQSGMQADIAESNELCAKVFSRVARKDGSSRHRQLRVTTPAGTDITLHFSDQSVWLNSDWHFEGRWHNIPSGEVFTWPADAEGTYVVDGVLGDHFDDKYGSLEDMPVRYTVVDNRITDIRCDNPALLQELEEYVFGTPDGDLLGELGIGTLPVESLVGQMLQDEKMLGTVHIAHGHGYADTGAPDTESTTHCDGVMRDATIELSDGTFLLKDGQYVED